MTSPVDTRSLVELSSRKAFRRGRILVLTMVAVSAIFLFWDEVQIIWSGGIHSVTIERVANWLILGCLCWYVTKGGRFAGGCFSILYGLIFLMFILAGIGGLFTNHFAVNVGKVVLDSGQGWSETFRFVFVGGWAAFSLWVLLISKDARLYMRARRQGIAEAEANAFEWPPAGRRQK